MTGINNEVDIHKRIDECRQFCTELSKIAGITKGLKKLSEESNDPEARYYFKSLLESNFKQLMIGLHVLTLDKYSSIRIHIIIDDFEKSYGGRLKELGLDQDITNEQIYVEELKPEILKWAEYRKNFAAHKNIAADTSFSVEIDTISLYIVVAIKILNTLIRTRSVPSYYPKHSNFVSYSITAAVNLEDESYKAISENLNWAKFE